MSCISWIKRRKGHTPQASHPPFPTKESSAHEMRTLLSTQQQEQSSLCAFPYPKLNSNTKTTRFITFASLSADLPIQLKLHVGDLTAPPRYVALSYVWGSPEYTETVKLDDLDFSVTPNIHRALLEIRRLFSSGAVADGVTMLWIDGICINQSDKKEKSHQVSLMRDLYMKAFLVFMWLGDGTSEIRDGLFTMAKLGKIARALMEETSNNTVLDKRVFSDSVIRRMKEIGTDILGKPVLTGVDAFWSSPYWRRAWILQEVVLARDAQVLCGSARISWDLIRLGEITRLCIVAHADLSSFTRMDVMSSQTSPHCAVQTSWQHHEFTRLGGHDTPAGRDFGASSVSFRFSLAYSSSRPDSLDLRSLLSYSGQLVSSDPRDKIYALLGMLPRDKLALPPDYTVDTSRVFCRAAWTLLSESRSLEILCWTRPERQATHMLYPSWVPDFSTEVKSPPRVNYSPAGNSTHRPSLSADGKELCVHGFSAGVVRHCADIVDTDMDTSFGFMVQFLRQHEEEFPLSHLEPKRYHWLETLLRTICEDGVPSFPKEPLRVGDRKIMVALRFLVRGVVDCLQSSGKPEDLVWLLKSAMPEEAALRSLRLIERLWANIAEFNESKEEVTTTMMLMGSILETDMLDPRINVWPEPTRELDDDSMLLMAASWLDRSKSSKNKLFLTTHGYLGWGPSSTEPGDCIALLHECPYPILLRPRADKFEMQGHGFIHGAMWGELVEAMSPALDGQSIVERREFCIV